MKTRDQEAVTNIHEGSCHYENMLLVIFSTHPSQLKTPTTQIGFSTFQQAIFISENFPDKFG